MQFVTSHNSPQTYWNLVENNFIHKDDYNQQIHKPYKPGRAVFPGYSAKDQYNSQFFTNHNSKTSHDNFNYPTYLSDNFYDPIHNNDVVNAHSFINNKGTNPYKNGDARTFYNYDPNLPYNNIKTPYANNYGYYNPNDSWDPYINPGQNLQAYVSQQVVKAADKKKMIDDNRKNINSFYPQDINPYDNFLKDFNPSDNYLTGRNNYHMATGSNMPLNLLQPGANVNVPPDAPPGVDPSYPVNATPPPDIMNQSLKELANNLGQTSMGVINDMVRYVDGVPMDIWSVFIRPDRVAYVGILIIIIAILAMVMFI